MQAKLWRHFDPLLVTVSLLLTAYGIAMIYAALASPGADGAARSAALREGLYGLFGLALFLAACCVDYRVFRAMFWPLCVGNVALLLAVLVLGRASGGAQRWLNLGFLPFQPSEFGKLLVILTLARVLADLNERITTLRAVFLSLLVAAVPAALVYPQPDLGTAVVYVAIWLGMVTAAGMRVRHLFLLLGALIAGAPFAVRFLHSYQLNRLTIFLNPQKDPTGAGYNIIQALIAIGSGGWMGQGFAQGAQSQLHYLRVQQSDFIFSAIAEQLGFLGCLLLFCLFAMLLTRILAAAAVAQDLYGRLVATGVMWMILFQAFVNVGMNLQMMPVTGIPLPFISAGGSSLITCLLAIGIVQSIRMRQRKLQF
ncbi:MAG TPA: rod shape-determining protein RodA [Chloroflexota bacterium]|nr:rod shape-determining protein RodA [Chloroflexota bacterium]